MSEFVLMTDSSADLNQEMVQELGVTVLPLSFTIQGRTYHDYPDCREMNLALFYDMLRAGELATTSALNVAEYTQGMEPILQAGKDILILAFSSDSGAYFAGCYLGKHKMAPVVSPKKTWEGVAGGVAAAVVVMVLYALILDLAFSFEVNMGAAIVYGVLGSATSVVGDLFFSVIKRQTGIKDFGFILPGHGGILDRFDSMTLVAPLAESLILLLPLIVG